MRCGFFSSPKRFVRKEHGGIPVEFAIIVPILVLLVFDIIDCGHAWYMRHLISDASRKGARHDTRYTGSPPNALNPSIRDYILDPSVQNSNKERLGSKALRPHAKPEVLPPTGTGYTSATPGNPLSVKVNVTKDCRILNKFIPKMGSTITISSTATMGVE
jgi:hypothetical protein